MGWLRNTVFILHGLKQFTKNGFEHASKTFDAGVMQRDLRGRIVIVTGANQGLGLEASKELAARGCTLYMVCRSEERGRAAVEKVQASSGNKDVHLRLCDLASLASVRTFTADINAKRTPVYLLVNNAGVLLNERATSVDGFELSFATNTLGTFLLTRLLEPALEQAGPGARVITVTSGGAYTEGLVTSDMEWPADKKYDGSVAYAQDKRRQIALTERFAERLGGHGVGCYCMHPGWAGTEGVKNSIPGFYKTFKDKMRSLYQGIDTVIWLALMDAAALEPGALYLDRQTQQKHLFMAGTQYTHSQVDDLWSQLERLCGLATPPPEAPAPEGKEAAPEAMPEAVEPSIAG